MKLFRILILIILLGNGLLFAEAEPQAPQTNLPKSKLTVGQVTLEVPTAVTAEQRAIGLMHRTSLGPNEGMLFVFDSPQQVTFWMKNTPLPLSIAYINPSGIILEIHKLKPFSEDLVQSAFSSILYALEMPRGWFERNDIQAGTKIQGLGKTP